MSTKRIETVFMGKPVTSPCLIPVLHCSTPNCVAEPFMVGATPYRVTALSFGTPHGAVVVDDADQVDVPSLGAALGTHALFPEGASIVFVQFLGGGRVKARLWQRGEGASGFSREAACVAGTAAMILQEAMKNEVDVFMNGRSARVEWDRETGVSISC